MTIDAATRPGTGLFLAIERTASLSAHAQAQSRRWDGSMRTYARMGGNKLLCTKWKFVFGAQRSEQ